MVEQSSLTQIQIIQSLGKRLADFEEELSWGAPAGELKFLTGRIGELYAAMISRGQMAVAVNQRGYDVISAERERISVKTCTTERPNAQFRKSTLELVDRIIVLKIHHGEDGVSIEELMDAPKDEALKQCSENPTTYVYNGSASRKGPLDLSRLAIIEKCEYENYSVSRYENGSIEVTLPDGLVASVTKDALRTLASKLGLRLNEPMNTQKMGRLVLSEISNLKQ